MEFDFKKWLPLFICDVIFIGIFLFGCNEVRKDSLAIRNWDQGVCRTVEAVCVDVRLYKPNRGNYRWEFTFSDGTTVAIGEDVRYGFDEEYFRSIMHQPLVYVYAEPSGALMDIREGDMSLLDTTYSGKNLYNLRTSSLFLAVMLSPLPLIYIVVTAVEVVKHFKKKKETV